MNDGDVWRILRRSFYGFVSLLALFHNRETSFICQGKRGFFVEKNAVFCYNLYQREEWSKCVIHKYSTS